MKNMSRILSQYYHEASNDWILLLIHTENSIKGGERSTCGSSQKVMIASCKSRLPRDFCVFMKNGKNKTRLIRILLEVLQDNFAKVLTSLHCSTMYISQEDVTYCLKSQGGRRENDPSLLPLNARGPVVKSCVAFTFRRY